MNKVLILLLLLFCSCVSTSRTNPSDYVSESGLLPTAVSPDSISNLSVLSAVGGICIVGGVIILVLPGASNLRGANALLIGIVLVLLNVGIREYLPYIYVPFIVGTGILSLAVTYRTVRYVLTWRNKCQSSQKLRPPLAPSGSSSS